MLFLSLIFVLFVSVAQSKKDEFRELPTTTNAMCLAMGLRPLEKQKLRPWTREEDLSLEEQEKVFGKQYSKMTVPDRTRTEIKSRFRSSNRWTSSSVSGSNRLTDEESTRLSEVIHALPNGVLSIIPWKEIANEHFTGWTPAKLSHQWHDRISKNELMIETVPLAALPSATVMAAVASATVAPAAVMAAVASQLTLAAYMTPGVEGAIDNNTLLEGSVFVCKGDFGMIDRSPTIALLKLKATFVAFGGASVSASNKITISTSKFINAYIFHVNIPLITHVHTPLHHISSSNYR